MNTTTTPWVIEPQPEHTGPLREDARAQVCVIGAGIAGLSTAYLLARQGVEVIVLDDGPIGGGESGRTTAHLTNAVDDRYFRIARLYGSENAKLVAASHTEAIAMIERIVAEEHIDCDFERLDGFLLLAPGQPSELLQREQRAARQTGVVAPQLLSRAPLRQFDTGPCLRFRNQAQFHPLRYLYGLAQAVQRLGGRIHTGTHVASISEPCTGVVTSSSLVVSASSVVLATNTPIIPGTAIHAKQACYRSYVIAGPVRHGEVPRALYWDTDEPYHYVRLAQGDAATELLIVGGEDHKTGQADDSEARYARLETWARKRFPGLGTIEYRWSGQIVEPTDSLPFIGRISQGPSDLYVATGDSGQGMTHGTIAGMVLSDLIRGHDNPWAALYDPGRITLGAAWNVARENANALGRYADWITRGTVRTTHDIPPASGAIVRRGFAKLAVYRDERGKLYEMSAVCPHRGCIVSWNSGEMTWDCPCHGSRFDARGGVLNGPATSGLVRQVGSAQPLTASHPPRSRRHGSSRVEKS